MAAMDMDKIRDELAEEAGKNPALEAIGEYVTERLRQGEALLEGKTLAGAYRAMEEDARKRNKGGRGCVCIPPTEATRIIDGYFGFGEQKTQACAEAERQGKTTDDLDLDALLEGL